MGNDVKQFMDCFETTPLVGKLSNECWGVATVGTRDQDNGLEDKLIGTDAEGMRYCYWDGAILKDDESGKYYMFASRWDQNLGHRGWGRSKAIYSVSDNLYGPYEDKGLVYPNICEGAGHNVCPFRLHEGETYNGKPMKYGMVLSDTARSMRGAILVTDKLGGEWNFTGIMSVEQDRFALSNIGIIPTPDGKYLAYDRYGNIAVADKITGSWETKNERLFSKMEYLAGYGDVEDPVIWYSGGLFHCVVNRWDARRAYYMTSKNGIDDWKIHGGIAYIPEGDIINYADGTVNRWYKWERPNAYIENGEVKAITFAVIDIPKEEEKGNDNHGSKIIVIPFNNDKLKKLDESIYNG